MSGLMFDRLKLTREKTLTDTHLPVTRESPLAVTRQGAGLQETLCVRITVERGTVMLV